MGRCNFWGRQIGLKNSYNRASQCNALNGRTAAERMSQCCGHLSCRQESFNYQKQAGLSIMPVKDVTGQLTKVALVHTLRSDAMHGIQALLHGFMGLLLKGLLRTHTHIKLESFARAAGCARGALRCGSCAQAC